MNQNFRFQVGSAGAGNAAFNRITISPYMTDLHLGTPASVAAYMWVDNLVVSTKPIRNPGFAAQAVVAVPHMGFSGGMGVSGGVQF